jgi:hypothetical protein
MTIFIWIQTQMRLNFKISQSFWLNLKISHFSIVCVCFCSLFGLIDLKIVEIISNFWFFLLSGSCWSLIVIVRIPWHWHWLYLFLFSHYKNIFQVRFIVVFVRNYFAFVILENWFFSWMWLLPRLVWLNFWLGPLWLGILLLSEGLNFLLFVFMKISKELFQALLDLFELR